MPQVLGDDVHRVLRRLAENLTLLPRYIFEAGGDESRDAHVEAVLGRKERHVARAVEFGAGNQRFGGNLKLGTTKVDVPAHHDGLRVVCLAGNRPIEVNDVDVALDEVVHDAGSAEHHHLLGRKLALEHGGGHNSGGEDLVVAHLDAHRAQVGGYIARWLSRAVCEHTHAPPALAHIRQGLDGALEHPSILAGRSIRDDEASVNVEHHALHVGEAFDECGVSHGYFPSEARRSETLSPAKLTETERHLGSSLTAVMNSETLVAVPAAPAAFEALPAHLGAGPAANMVST